jgi:hypothetical protein
MNGVEVTRSALDASHRWFSGTIADLTPELTNFLPPGKVHPIGELVVHTINAEDYFINQRLRGGSTVWERGGWGENLGLPFMLQHDEQASRDFRCDLLALQPYIDAVFSETSAYVDALGDADLDRTLPMGPLGDMRAGDIIQFFIVGNTLAHTGEISAIKGLQGAKGYPF